MNACTPRPVRPEMANPNPVPEEMQLAGYDARALIRNGVQSAIHLDGQIYFLRITRAGKLILTK